MRARRGLGLGLLLVLVAALLGGLPSAASASCVAPTVSIGVADGPPVPYTDGETVTVHPGDRVVVVGQWFHDGCNDTGAVEVGCRGPVVTTADEERPMTDVELAVELADERKVLGTADADPAEDHYTIFFDTRLPADLATGPATLWVGPVLVVLEIDPGPTAG